MKLKELYAKYKAMIWYVFFGVCTTLVNVIVYWLFAHPFDFGVGLSTVIAWIIAVLFAYFTNRRWVFHSNAKGVKERAKELFSFFLCRLTTGFIDWLCMYMFVECFKWNDVVVKIGTNVLVIILNYIASKLLVFKKKEEDYCDGRKS